MAKTWRTACAGAAVRAWRHALRAEGNLFIVRMFLTVTAYIGVSFWLNAVRQTVPAWLLWTLIALQLFLFLTIFVVSYLRLLQCQLATWWLWIPMVLSRVNDWEIVVIPVTIIVMLAISEWNRRVSREKEHLVPSNEATGTEVATVQKEMIPMHDPIADFDKQLRDTPLTDLRMAIVLNREIRKACLFIGAILAAAVLFFSWSKWFLLIPAVFGIGSLLCHMNIVIVFSEIERRSEDP